MPDLTIFTAPKPFTNPHIDTIQRNAIQTWIQLGSQVEVLLIGEEDGLEQVAAEYEVRYLPDVARNGQGTPLVSSIFALARQHSRSPLLAYVNADILLLPEFQTAAHQVAGQAPNFLVVGQRWDLDLPELLSFDPDWVSQLRLQVQARGRLHPPGGSDYFIFPRQCFTAMPGFAIGRAGWDNWMFFHARQQGWPVVDATRDILIIHQDHDYSHLPGGQPHYRLPETAENVRLAGGQRAIFSLADADFCLENGKIRPIARRGKRLRREIETFPLVHLKSTALAELFFAFFHPVKAWGEWRGRLVYKTRQIIKGRGEGA